MQDVYELMKKASQPEEEEDLYSLMKEASVPEEEVPEPVPALFQEEKPSFMKRISDFGRKVFPSLKEAALMTPQAQQIKTAALARQVERERPEPPEIPTIGAMRPIEKERYEAALERPLPIKERPKYGRFEALIDVPGQFMSNFIKSFLWGLPEFVPGEEPVPKTEVSEALGALGSLAGLAGAGVGKLAMYAPFKVTRAIATRIWKKPAKTLAGKVVQNVVKNANTLGLALGAAEWEGEDAAEILKNKAQSFISGEAIGGFFGGMQFMHFSKLHPMLSFIIRYGTGSALLDFAMDKRPLDERSLFNKIFDYGLNAYFLQHGVSPRTYQRASFDLVKEIKRFNKQTKAEGINIELPESLEAIRNRITPETWARPTAAPERLMPAATRIAAEKGVIIPPETPEAARLKIGYRAAEGLKPGEISPLGEKITIKINPTPEGGVSVEIPTIPGVKGAKGFEPPIRRAGPKISPVRTELLDAIKEDIGKIKPNQDYSRKALINMGLPTKMIAAKDSKFPTMDEAASTLSKKFTFIEYDSDLEHVLRTTRGLEKPRITEEEYYERKAEEYEEKVPEPEKEYKWSREKEVDELFFRQQRERLQKMIDEGKSLEEVHKQIPKEMPVSEFPKKLIDYHELKFKEEAIPKEVPSAAEEARRARLEESKRAKEVIEELPVVPKGEEALYNIYAGSREKGSVNYKQIKGFSAVEKGKHTVDEVVNYLEKKGIEIINKPSGEEVKIPEAEVEELPKAKKMKLAKVSITLPTGEKWDLGDLPVERIKSVQEYAKKLGVERSLKVDRAEEREWKEYLSPTELEPFMRTMIRDIKTKPTKEEWELYSGYPFTKEIKDAAARIQKRHKVKERAKLYELKKELQKTDKGKVEWMYLEAEKQFKEKRKPSFKAAFKGAKRAFVDTSGNVKKDLIKNLGPLGKEATIQHDLIAGASAKSERLFEEASKKIYSKISRAEEALFNRAIQSRRTVAVSKYKPDIRHPLGLTAKEHTEYMKTIPKEINERADLYFKEMEKVLDNLKSEGLIDAESYKNLKSKGDYSPRLFIQHVDPESTYVIGGKTITVPDSGIKALDQGSYQVMETNSRLLLSSVISRTQARIFRNRANKAAYNLAKEIPENGIFKLAKVIKTTKEGKPIYQPAPAGHTKIKAMVEGKAKEMIMPDKYVREWLTRDPLINEQLANIIGWASGSKILKPMATGLNPGFALTNFPRDIGHVWIVSSEYSGFVPKFTFQIARDFMSTAKDTFLRKGRWIDYLDEGGGMTFLTHQGRPFKTRIRWIKKLQEALGYLGETSEIWTRLALRERAIRNGKSPYEATWEARNYLDFSQGGNVAKALDTGIPYLNAGIQGTRGIFRAAADRPVETIWKFAQLGALASGLYLANRYGNKECWDHISDRDKVNNFNITTPFSFTDKSGNKRFLYFRIAKDQGQRVVCTLFENLMQKSLGEEVNADQITQSIQEFIPIIPSQNIPPSLDAMMGYYANKDFWTNKDIWKGDKITPREEYTIYTHPALVKAGKLTGLSPAKLDYSLSQLFTRGNVYTSLVSGGFSLAMKDLPAEDKRKTTMEIVTRLPLLRRIFRATPPYSITEIKQLEKARTEESTRRYKQRRELGEMSNRYYRKLKDEKIKDTTLFRDIKVFIKNQPVEDRKRLDSWFKRYGIIYDIPDKSWWLNLAEMPPEARATVYWTKYLETPEDERMKLNRLAKKVPGIWSERFLKRLRILIAKWRRQE